MEVFVFILLAFLSVFDDKNVIDSCDTFSYEHFFFLLSLVFVCNIDYFEEIYDFFPIFSTFFDVYIVKT